jgi:hypothetical protein
LVGFGRLDVAASAREVVAGDLYALPAALLLRVGEKRTLTFAPDTATIRVPADAPFTVGNCDGNTLVVRGLRPGNASLEISQGGYSRVVPVTVAASGGSAACRVGTLMYPRYLRQPPEAGNRDDLCGFCNLQCPAPQAMDGCWWTNYWVNGGYAFHCLSTWELVKADQGQAGGILFPPLSPALIAPGIYEMGISLSVPPGVGGRSFFVNLY